MQNHFLSEFSEKRPSEKNRITGSFHSAISVVGDRSVRVDRNQLCSFAATASGKVGEQLGRRATIMMINAQKTVYKYCPVVLVVALVWFHCGGAASEEGLVADPGPDQTLHIFDRVTLDGSESNSPTGVPLKYRWTQLAGRQVTLEDPESSTPSFIAPGERDELRFSLQVADDQGVSAPNEVTVSVRAYSGERAQFLSNEVQHRIRTPKTRQNDLQKIQGEVRHVVVDSGHAYVAVSRGSSGANGAVVIFDVSDPLRPKQVSEIGIISPTQVAVYRGHLFAIGNTTNGRLLIADVSTPSKPANIKKVNVFCNGGTLNDIAQECAKQFVINGNYVYIARDRAGLGIVDITDLSAPESIAALNLDTGGDAESVTVVDGVAYVADFRGGVSAFAIDNPRAPVQKFRFGLGKSGNFVPTSRPRAVVAVGETHVYASVTGELIVKNPVEGGASDRFGRLGLGKINHLLAAGDYLYVAGEKWADDSRCQRGFIGFTGSQRERSADRQAN